MKIRFAQVYKNRGVVLAMNVTGAALFRSLSLFANILTVAFAVRALTPADYGQFATISMIYSVFSFADLGLGSAIINHVSGRKIDSKAKENISSVFYMLFFFGLAFFASISVAIEIFISELYEFSNYYELVAVICVGLPATLAQRILTSQHRDVEGAFYAALGRILSIFLIYLCFSFKVDIGLFVHSLLIPPFLVNWISSFVIYRRYIGRFTPNIRDATLHKAFANLKYGLGFFVLTLCASAVQSFDNSIISFFMGSDFVYRYDIMARLFIMIPVMISFIMVPIWPFLRSLHVENDMAKFEDYAMWTSLLVSVATSALAILIVFFHSDIITFWTGSVFEGDYLMASLLAVLCVAVSVCSSQSVSLNARGIITPQLYFSIIATPLLIAAKALAAFEGSIYLIVISSVIYCSLRWLYLKFLGSRPVQPVRDWPRTDQRSHR